MSAPTPTPSASASSPLIKYTRPSPTIHLLTLSSPPDNRLTPAFLRCLASHLDDIEANWRRSGGGEMDPRKRKEMGGGDGAVVITSECKGFFSNGLDYKASLGDKRFFQDTFDPVLYRLLTFPLVTIAAINGHGGFVLALACDFRIMTSGRGLMCMNELTFSSPLPNSFAPLLSSRIPHPGHLRDTLLARRWTQPEALAMGVLDEVVDDTQPDRADKLLERAYEIARREGAKVGPGSWGAMKDQTYHAYIDASASGRPIAFPNMEGEAFWKRYGNGKGDGGGKAAREAKL